jgi:hypothetical protein
MVIGRGTTGKRLWCRLCKIYPLLVGADSWVGWTKHSARVRKRASRNCLAFTTQPILMHCGFCRRVRAPATAVGGSILAAKLALEGRIVYRQEACTMQEEEIMSARVYLTIAAVVAILYSLAFLLIPYKRRFSLVALLRLAQFYIFGSAVPQFWRGD